LFAEIQSVVSSELHKSSGGVRFSGGHEVLDRGDYEGAGVGEVDSGSTGAYGPEQGE
jgi:hypothetical protein